MSLPLACLRVLFDTLHMLKSCTPAHMHTHAQMDSSSSPRSNGGKLSALSVTMKKHPESLFPVKGSPEFDANEAAKEKDGEVILYEGPVAALAKLFPVNVNTICTAALAASATLGMAGVTAKLIADRGLEEMIIETRARGLVKIYTGSASHCHAHARGHAFPGRKEGRCCTNPSELGCVVLTCLFPLFSFLFSLFLLLELVDGLAG